MSKTPIRGELSCPPPDDPLKKFLSVDSNGVGTCQYERSINLTKMMKMDEKEEPRASYSDLIAPYVQDFAQRKILMDIFGRQNVHELEVYNMLHNSGLIRQDCKYYGMEEYTNKVTGERGCRPAFDKRRIANPEQARKSCPDPRGDPLAIQKYIDILGHVKCIRPIYSGKFQCPPKDKPNLTNLARLPDGTGICVADDSWESMQPRSIMYDRTMQEKLKDYQKILKEIDEIDDVSSDVLMDMNGYFKSFSNVNSLMLAIRKKEYYPLFKNFFHKINAPEDISLANNALLKVTEHKYPSLFKSHKDWMKWYGVSKYSLSNY